MLSIFFHEHTSEFLPQNLLPLTCTRNANHVFFLLSQGRTPLPDHSWLGQGWTPDSSWPKLHLSRESGSRESRLLTARVLDWEVMGRAPRSRESWSVGSGNAEQTAGETVELRKRGTWLLVSVQSLILPPSLRSERSSSVPPNCTFLSLMACGLHNIFL